MERFKIHKSSYKPEVDWLKNNIDAVVDNVPTTTASNQGGGAEAYIGPSAEDLQFRTITATGGDITVTQNATTLDLSLSAPVNALSNVDTSSEAEGEVLTYDATGSQWVNRAPTSTAKSAGAWMSSLEYTFGSTSNYWFVAPPTGTSMSAHSLANPSADLSLVSRGMVKYTGATTKRFLVTGGVGMYISGTMGPSGYRPEIALLAHPTDDTTTTGPNSGLVAGGWIELAKGGYQNSVANDGKTITVSSVLTMTTGMVVFIAYYQGNNPVGTTRLAKPFITLTEI